MEWQSDQKVPDDLRDGDGVGDREWRVIDPVARDQNVVQGAQIVEYLVLHVSCPESPLNRGIIHEGIHI